MTWSDDEFDPLFRSVYPRVLRAAELFLGERAAAEDVAQEAFARLLARAPVPPDGAERWVFRVARNLAVDRLRHLRRLAPLEEAAGLPAFGSEASAVGAASRGAAGGASDESLAALRRAVASLPARQREVVGLRIYGELAYEEIATAVGRSLGSVKQDLHRARQALIAKFDGNGLEDDDGW